MKRNEISINGGINVAMTKEAKKSASAQRQ